MEIARGRRRKVPDNKRVDWFVVLPDDILVDILKRFPDAFLRYKAKHVCRRWFDIITNKILLDHASFIVQKMGNTKPYYVDIREEQQGLLVKEQYLDIPRAGMIRSWCNEFLLISDFERKESLYVLNLITKEVSDLPECTASCGGHDTTGRCGVALSFDRFKGIYKVVHLFMGPPIQCEILILGRDIVCSVSSKWKKMEVPYMNEGQYCWGDPVLIKGRYLHWDVICSNNMVSLDMVKEEIVQMRQPGSGDRSRFVPFSFVLGGSLTKIEKVSRDKAEIWILKDFERKKWEKLKSVTLDNFLKFNGYSGDLCPISGVINKRYIILESRPVKQRLFSYDMKYGVMKELALTERYDHCVVHSSVPSFI